MCELQRIQEVKVRLYDITYLHYIYNYIIYFSNDAFLGRSHISSFKSFGNIEH